MSAETGLGGWIDGSAGGVGSVGWLIGLALVVAAGTFFLAPGLAAYPLGAVAIVVAYGWLADEATTARTLALAATVATVSVLGLITIYLVAKSLPAFRLMGLDVLTKTDGTLWASSVPVYSLVPMIWGTLLATSIAAAIAAPLGIAGAVFISETAPDWARSLLKPAIEMLAGVPSIVYGFIGFELLNQFMADEFAPPTYGSLFVAGCVIGAMVLPTVVSVAEDAITSVSGQMKDGSLALAATGGGFALFTSLVILTGVIDAN